MEATRNETVIDVQNAFSRLVSTDWTVESFTEAEITQMAREILLQFHGSQWDPLERKSFRPSIERPSTSPLDDHIRNKVAVILAHKKLFHLARPVADTMKRNMTMTDQTYRKIADLLINCSPDLYERAIEMMKDKATGIGWSYAGNAAIQLAKNYNYTEAFQAIDHHIEDSNHRQIVIAGICLVTARSQSVKAGLETALKYFPQDSREVNEPLTPLEESLYGSIAYLSGLKDSEASTDPIFEKYPRLNKVVEMAKKTLMFNKTENGDERERAIRCSHGILMKTPFKDLDNTLQSKNIFLFKVF